MKMQSKSHGFTLVEVILTIVIFTALFGFISITLLTVKHRASINVSAIRLVTDLKSQQIKAMVGDTEGREVSDHYGIYFETGRYVLFHGSTYNPSDADNFPINLDDNIEVGNISFPGSVVIFLRGSGEISGFVTGSDTIRIRNTQNNEQKIITLNRYGVVTGVN